VGFDGFDFACQAAFEGDGPVSQGGKRSQDEAIG
jgi:hypothetical protein